MQEKLELLKRLYKHISKGEWQFQMNHWGKADIVIPLEKEPSEEDSLINGNPVEYIIDQIDPDNAWFITEIVKAFPDIIEKLESLQNIEEVIQNTKEVLDEAGIVDKFYGLDQDGDRILSLEERVNYLIKRKENLEHEQC